MAPAGAEGAQGEEGAEGAEGRLLAGRGKRRTMQAETGRMFWRRLKVGWPTLCRLSNPIHAFILELVVSHVNFQIAELLVVNK